MLVIHLLNDTPMTLTKEQTDGVTVLYTLWVHAWNRRNAAGMAQLFGKEATMIGYDGTIISGKDELTEILTHIFAHLPTAAFVTIVRDITPLSDTVVLLRADAGMVQDGQEDISPSLNTVQTLIGTNTDGKWEISYFQNTPAVLHARPDVASQMTDDLRKELRRLIAETNKNLN